MSQVDRAVLLRFVFLWSVVWGAIFVIASISDLSNRALYAGVVALGHIAAGLWLLARTLPRRD